MAVQSEAAGTNIADFETEFRVRIIETLNLEDIGPDSIRRETVLFKDGLGLDSIDAIELVIMIEKEYGIVLTVPERNETVFRTFGILCDFVFQNRGRNVKL
jgi:acyl carrier protein